MARISEHVRFVSGSHSAACFASRSTSSFPRIPLCEGVHWMVGSMPLCRALSISLITLCVMYCAEEMAGCATACIAAWLSVKIVTPLQPSSSCAIWGASSMPTSSAEYTVDWVLSPGYLVFPLPASGHHATAPTCPWISLPSAYMAACVAFFFRRRAWAL